MRFAVLLTAALAVATPALAQQRTPIQNARHDGFEALGKAMKTMGEQLRSGAPDAAVLKRNAAVVTATAPKVKTWFPAGSGTGKTDALPAIWTDNATFLKLAANFETEAKKFGAIANAPTLDVAAFGGQMRAVGGTCKACHDKFKKDD
jgi:cytochrome c556